MAKQISEISHPHTRGKLLPWPLVDKEDPAGQKRGWGDSGGDVRKEKYDLVHHLFPISSFPLPLSLVSLHTPPCRGSLSPGVHINHANYTDGSG